MKKKKLDLPVLWMEQTEGTDEWYVGMHYGGGPYEIYEAEDMISMGLGFSGNQIYFIHYPDGEVYAPLKKKENVYYERPVWDEDRFGIAAVHFGKREVIIYSFMPGKEVQILHKIPLTDIHDCYNLRIEASPLTLSRQKDQVYEILWPEKKRFAVKENDSMIYRDGNTLYFSRWAETPEYLEYVVAVNVETGEEISVEKGNLYRMPDGSFWLV